MVPADSRTKISDRVGDPEAPTGGKYVTKAVKKLLTHVQDLRCLRRNCWDGKKQPHDWSA